MKILKKIYCKFFIKSGIENKKYVFYKRLYPGFYSYSRLALKNVKSSLNKISKSLEEIQVNREFLLKNTREIIILCSRSIISIHKGDYKTGKRNITQADLLLKKYRKKATSELQRYLITAEQEYVEAVCFLAVVKGNQIPSREKLKVMQESYVLGLLDCIGELKRMILDKIRIGDIDIAIKIFDVMENLYLYLYPFSMYDKVVKEVRRKIDVNRILVEDVRGAITEEKRRSELIKELRKLKK